MAGQAYRSPAWGGKLISFAARICHTYRLMILAVLADRKVTYERKPASNPCKRSYLVQ